MNPTREQLMSWATAEGEHGEWTRIPTSAWESVLWLLGQAEKVEHHAPSGVCLTPDQAAQITAFVAEHPCSFVARGDFNDCAHAGGGRGAKDAWCTRCAALALLGGRAQQETKR